MIRVEEIVFDTNDLQLVSSFWAALLEQPRAVMGEDWVVVDTGAGIRLGFQPVPEGKQSPKNRLHLDLLVDDVAGTVARAVALGATRIPDERGDDGAVLVDPEGNEFCLTTDEGGDYERRVRAALGLDQQPGPAAR